MRRSLGSGKYETKIMPINTDREAWLLWNVQTTELVARVNMRYGQATRPLAIIVERIERILKKRRSTRH